MVDLFFGDRSNDVSLVALSISSVDPDLVLVLVDPAPVLQIKKTPIECIAGEEVFFEVVVQPTIVRRTVRTRDRGSITTVAITIEIIDFASHIGSYLILSLESTFDGHSVPSRERRHNALLEISFGFSTLRFAIKAAAGAITTDRGDLPRGIHSGTIHVGINLNDLDSLSEGAHTPPSRSAIVVAKPRVHAIDHLTVDVDDNLTLGAFGVRICMEPPPNIELGRLG